MRSLFFLYLGSIEKESGKKKSTDILLFEHTTKLGRYFVPKVVSCPVVSNPAGYDSYAGTVGEYNKVIWFYQLS